MATNHVQRFRENLMMSKAELARKAGLSTLTIDRVEAGRPCRLDTKSKILSGARAQGFRQGSGVWRVGGRTVRWNTRVAWVTRVTGNRNAEGILAMNISLPGFGKATVIGLDIGSHTVKAVEIVRKSRDKGFDLRVAGSGSAAARGHRPGRVPELGARSSRRSAKPSRRARSAARTSPPPSRVTP